MNEDDKILEKQGANWWEDKINRRDANKKVLQYGAAGAFIAMVGISLIVGSNDDDDDSDDVEKQEDAIDLQKREGWDVGAKDKNLTYPSNFVVTTDSKGTDKWKTYLNAFSLISAYSPTESKFMPYYVPTLAQVLDEDSMRDSFKLIFTPEMAQSYSRGLGFKALLEENKNNENILVIVDIQGAASVAFGAALADAANIITTFDNRPHPIGIVPSHLTLSAMVYYAGEIEEKKKNAKELKSNVFILDRNRFKEQINEDTEFDNRYMAKLPSIDDLMKFGVTNIMYCTLGATQESDDLNDDFVAYKKAEIDVKMVNLADFKANETGTPDSISNGSTANMQSAYHTAPPVYYYGGGHSYMPLFFTYYAFMSPYRSYPRTMSYGGSMPRPSSFTPSPRPTVFSSSRVGGSSGIGRTRPSGFGRVTTRVSGTTGRMTGVRAGKSGSFGRVGGRGG